jgi:hypothetical protein
LPLADSAAGPSNALLGEKLMLRWRNPFRALAEMNNLAKVCLATGASALIVALLGSLVNLFVGNWFQAGGMAVVGVFYLVLFVTSYPPSGAAAIGAAEFLPPDHGEHRERHRA